MASLSYEKVISSYVPLPICVINKQGKVLSASNRINEVFIYDRIVDSDIFTLTGIKATDLYEIAISHEYPLIRRNEKIFKLIPQRIGSEEEALLSVLFSDVTTFEELKERYNDERMCVAKIQVDNYDELMADMAAQERQSLTNSIDRIIRRWAERASASINEIDNNIYVITFEQYFLEKLKSLKFSILDEVRSLETSADFPASLSIGVGVGGRNPAETEEYADAALDLALGRGGDQAVVKKNRKIEYFGGTLQTVEKRNKGKSRIVGHALKQLIDQSKKIFIMGHSNPDMDCFGAALGVMRLCALREIEPYIVIDNYKEALQVIFKQAKESDEYRFINSEKAKSLADKDSLLIVLDTHRPSMVECPELLEICERVVVIDHHRRVEEFIENPVLAYMESYASSTSELVTEILQYMTSKKTLIKLEAEALLAGITIDTNGFTVKAGVRTFEAAAWLRRQGADPTEVSRFFQEDLESFEIKAKALAEAHFYEEGIVVSICSRRHPDEQVICAQVADQLLTVRGVKASFVAGINGEGRTVISARSLGEINVQTVMERFNGGGHLTTAAAQVDMPPGEAIRKVLEIMEVK
ncbi:MAG: DHH family phosphoesterase [Firmicutes bacterium]|jgi:c-di-AMP phosphodiesterase-like protein|nr:DHH family phosphoesterase [Bacillota bacterium]